MTPLHVDVLLFGVLMGTWRLDTRLPVIAGSSLLLGRLVGEDENRGGPVKCIHTCVCDAWTVAARKQEIVERNEGGGGKPTSDHSYGPWLGHSATYSTTAPGGQGRQPPLFTLFFSFAWLVLQVSRGQANDALTDGYVPYVPLHLLRHPPFSIIILICPPFALSFVWSRGRWVSSRVYWKTRTANYASFVPLPPSLELSRQAQTFPKNTCWKLCVCVCLKPSHRTLRVIYSWFRVTSHSSAKVLRWYIFF